MKLHGMITPSGSGIYDEATWRVHHGGQEPGYWVRLTPDASNKIVLTWNHAAGTILLVFGHTEDGRPLVDLCLEHGGPAEVGIIKGEEPNE